MDLQEEFHLQIGTANWRKWDWDTVFTRDTQEKCEKLLKELYHPTEYRHYRILKVTYEQVKLVTDKSE